MITHYVNDSASPDWLRAVSDDPARVAAPDYEEAGPAFGELPIREQLDIAETVCRREPYHSALGEALPESDRYQSFLHMLLDSNCPDAVVGKLARELVLDYLQAVAVAQHDDLAELRA